MRKEIIFNKNMEQIILTEENKNKKARDFGVEKKSYNVLNWFDETAGVRRLIKNVCGSYFCQYIGIPKGHSLYEINYDEIPINCHGGLTFSDNWNNINESFPKNYWWIGWDYSHIGDYCYTKNSSFKMKDTHDWTLEEVVDNGSFPAYDFGKLMRLIEKVNNANSVSKGV